jgi:hypothetical protein
MHIDPIYAGPVAIAHALAIASRVQSNSEASRHPKSSVGTPLPRRRHFSPLQRLAHWWRALSEPSACASDPVQLMMWSEPWGRPYNAALGVVLLMHHLRKGRTKNHS